MGVELQHVCSTHSLLEDSLKTAGAEFLDILLKATSYYRSALPYLSWRYLQLKNKCARASNMWHSVLVLGTTAVLPVFNRGNNLTSKLVIHCTTTTYHVRVEIRRHFLTELFRAFSLRYGMSSRRSPPVPNRQSHISLPRCSDRTEDYVATNVRIMLQVPGYVTVTCAGIFLVI